ncbi:MAG TPA: helix-turn-helix domain-containing protein [Caulobacteraceae bacterium]|nr:helix-turn-helix domain-containing protein [Caulobacteraceae bacterium]
MARDLSIGDLALETGVKAPTIRYYEQIGLLPAPPRSEGNRRLYAASDVRRLKFIRHARDLGFEIEPIRTLLALQDHPDQSCAECDAVARARLAEVEARIARLQSLKAELTRMIDSGSHGRVADCRVIEVLADHELCAHETH